MNGKPLNNQSSNRTNLSIAELRDRLDGKVITPDDHGYDQARTIFYGGYDFRPALIVRAANAADVSKTVLLARDTGLELAVRGGGHSNAGYGVSEGGIVLDLGAMKGLKIDPDKRTAWAETGLTAIEYTTETAKYGLATGFGDTGSVGIGGITLGGGVGYLARKYGLTIDSLVAAEVVTADGRLLRADATNHPDLFWAIRGGGGNFGVAVRFQYRLHEVSTVVGGMLMLPASAETIANLVAEAEAAPEELSIIANIMPAPPMPFVPAEHHGKLAIMALMVYVGEVGAGLKAVAPLKALATPIVDMIRPMPYPQIYSPDDPNYHPLGFAHTMFVDKIDRGVAETIVERLQASSAQMSVTQIRVLGGAVSRVPVEATAYAHRNSRIMVNVAALFGSPDEAPVHTRWAEEFAAALNQGDDGAYVNFLAREGDERVRAAYPGPTWDRLRAIKAVYDPTNLFHLNQNIPPPK